MEAVDWEQKYNDLKAIYDKEHEALKALNAAKDVTIPLEMLIGNMDHLECERKTFELKGLTVACVRYSNPLLPSSAGNPPTIAIHGGPGCPHGYILPLKLLAHKGFPVIFYDQAGCGDSTFVKDPATDAPWLLTIDYYTLELQALIAAYALKEYYVFGSSWGTCIAQEFALTQPPGLLGLILDGPLSDSDLYIRSQRTHVLSSVPTLTRGLLLDLDEKKQYESPIYQKIDRTLSTWFTSRQTPRPDCYAECISKANFTIYTAMQGPSEFSCGGVLAGWSVRSRAGEIRVPTLVQRGEFDTMSEVCAQALVDDIPTAMPLVTIPRAAHCKLIDEPELCVASIVRFLSIVESARNQAKRQLQ